MPLGEKIVEPRKVAMYFTLLYTVFFVLLFLIYKNFFSTVLFTFIAVMVVDAVASLLRKVKIPRMMSTILSLITCFSLLLWGLIAIIPAAFTQIADFYKLISDVVEKRAWEQYIQGNQDLLNMLNGLVDFIKPSINELANYLIRTVAGQIPGALVILFFTILGTIYVSLYARSILQVVPLLYPKRSRDHVKSFLDELKINMRRFIGVIALNAVIVGAAFYILFRAMNLRYAPLVAFWAFLTNFIPIVGVVFEFIPIFLFSLSLGLEGMLWIVLFSVLIHLGVFVLFFEVMKGYAKVNPVLMIFAILVTGEIFGPAGVFFGVPAAVFAVVFYKQFLRSEFERD
ncbi:AI-2E family transporter [Pseudothermotoga sp. U03pept]|uniref:AI-2E family transporter n=1 Tax=Pseudothermotoga sp. U03pept TaxID=3447012 RepID=UPI003F0A35CD